MSRRIASTVLCPRRLSTIPPRRDVDWRLVAILHWELALYILSPSIHIDILSPTEDSRGSNGLVTNIANSTFLLPSVLRATPRASYRTAPHRIASHRIKALLPRDERTYESTSAFSRPSPPPCPWPRRLTTKPTTRPGDDDDGDDDTNRRDGVDCDVYGVPHPRILGAVARPVVQRPGLLDAPQPVQRRLLARHPPHHARRIIVQVRGPLHSGTQSPR